MFKHIIYFDWLHLKANRSVGLILGISGILIFFALWTGSARVKFQQNTLQIIKAQEQSDYEYQRKIIAEVNAGQQFDGGHFGDPTNPYFFGNRMGAKYATLTPAKLAIISTGQSDLMPYYYKLTLSKRQALFHSEELENPQILYNGSFDVSFVIIFLLPLLIIGLTYNVVSSEREQGTLALLLAETMRFGDIIRLRYLFRYLLLNLSFTMFIIVGLVFFRTNIFDAFKDVAYLLLIIWAYSAFWFGLSFLINSFGKNSGYNAAVLTGVWLGLVLLVPTLVSVYVNRVHPMPSRLELITKTREVGDQLNKESAQSLNRFYEEHAEFRPDSSRFDAKDENVKRLFSRLSLEVALEKEIRKFEEIAAQRQATVNMYRFLSPAIFVQQSLNDASGTGTSRYNNFEKQVTTFHQTYRDYFAPLVYKQEKFTVSNLDKVPEYQYIERLNTIFNGFHITNLLFLISVATGFLIVACIKVRKVNLATNYSV
jgi:ABC-2 type transport system permease protein